MDWKHYLFSATGRLNRGKYWLAFFIFFGISILCALLGVSFINAIPGTDSALLYIGIAGAAVYFILTYSSIVIAIKRLHDRDKSGWWLLLFYFLPGVLPLFVQGGNSTAALIVNVLSFALYIWALVELGFLRGTAGPNRFGPDPLQGTRDA